MLWLPFNEASGTTIYDASGNGRSATLSGGWWTNGPSYWCDESVTNWINSPTDMFSGATGLTISVWGNVKNTANRRFFVEELFASTNKTRYAFEVLGTDKLAFGGRTVLSDAYRSVTSSVVIPQAEWCLFSGVADGSGKSIVLYTNGAVVSSTGNANFSDSTFSANTPDAITIGVQNGTGLNDMNGAICHLRLWRRCLSPEEIAAIYALGKPNSL